MTGIDLLGIISVSAGAIIVFYLIKYGEHLDNFYLRFFSFMAVLFLVSAVGLAAISERENKSNKGFSAEYIVAKKELLSKHKLELERLCERYECEEE